MSSLVGVFKKRISAQEFKEYCAFYGLAEKQTKKELTRRGYHVKLV